MDRRAAVCDDRRATLCDNRGDGKKHERLPTIVEWALPVMPIQQSRLRQCGIMFDTRNLPRLLAL